MCTINGMTFRAPFCIFWYSKSSLIGFKSHGVIHISCT